MPVFEAVIFDLDDTLFPEREFVLSGFRAVATWAESNLGLENGYAKLVALFEAGVQSQTFNVWLRQEGRDETSVPDMICTYREHMPSIRPFPDAVETLTMLSRVAKLGLVSDGYLEVQRRKLAALGLSHFFTSVVFSDQFGREHWKPSTIPFATILRNLDCAPYRAVYVGDNPKKDFLGARQLNMHTVRIVRSDGIYAKLEPPSELHAPHREIVSLLELEQIFTS